MSETRKLLTRKIEVPFPVWLIVWLLAVWQLIDIVFGWLT